MAELGTKNKNGKNMDLQKEFIQQTKEIRDYWLSLPDKTTEEIVDGVLFSMLVMFDGDSAINDFHALKIIDTHTGTRIDCGYLHDLYFTNRIRESDGILPTSIREAKKAYYEKERGNMTNPRIHLTKWEYEGTEYVRLFYEDGDSFLVNKTDFNRTFMSFCSASKEEILRDFAI